MASSKKKAYLKNWGLLNKKRRQDYMLFFNFGITREQYDDILRRQKGCCAICGRHSDEFTKRLAVDHDHHTKEIRGLLCSYCNRSILGRHRRDKGGNLLLAAYNYLMQEYTGLFVPVKKRKKRHGRSRLVR